jgi:hypothetical protein
MSVEEVFGFKFRPDLYYNEYVGTKKEDGEIAGGEYKGL